jgi:hypothetical protein
MKVQSLKFDLRPGEDTLSWAHNISIHHQNNKVEQTHRDATVDHMKSNTLVGLNNKKGYFILWGTDFVFPLHIVLYHLPLGALKQLSQGYGCATQFLSTGATDGQHTVQPSRQHTVQCTTPHCATHCGSQFEAHQLHLYGTEATVANI